MPYNQHDEKKQSPAGDINNHEQGTSETTEKREKAAKRIQESYRQLRMWNKFVENPRHYDELSNDKIGQQMFGKHIASFFKQDLVDTGASFVTTQINKQYHRSENSAITADDFHSFPQENLSHLMQNKSTHDTAMVTQLGITRSLWRETLSSQLKNRIAHSMTPNGRQTLSAYAQTADALLSCRELNRLQHLAADKRFNFSLHAQELHTMIGRVLSAVNQLGPLDLTDQQRIQDGIARLHFFLTLLVKFNNCTHTKFAAIFEAVIHEVSLLALDCMLLNHPIVSHAEFAQSVSDEMLGKEGKPGILGVPNKTQTEPSALRVCAYPANSGMHAHSLALLLCGELLGQEKSSSSFYAYSNNENKNHYYETNPTREPLLESLGIKENKTSPNVHVLNGSVMNGFTPYTAGESLNQFVSQLNLGEASSSSSHPPHHIVVIDITTTDYKNLKLKDKTKAAIESGQLSVVFWQSWQKVGLLGTDQAQFGRAFVLTNPTHQAKLAKMDDAASKDMSEHIDMQIGALFQVSREQSGAYQDFNFLNGQLLRTIIPEAIPDVNKSSDQYDLLLMSDLSEDQKNEKKNTVYLDKEGNYIVIDSHGTKTKGSFDANQKESIKAILNHLSEEYNNDASKKKIFINIWMNDDISMAVYKASTQSAEVAHHVPAAKQVGPFVVNADLNALLGLFPNTLAYARDSFGFNYVTQTSGIRVSAGSEPTIDIEIYGHYLKLLCEYSDIRNIRANGKEVSAQMIVPLIINHVKNYFEGLQLNHQREWTKEDMITLCAHLQAVNFLIQVMPDKRSLLKTLGDDKLLVVCHAFLRPSDTRSAKIPQEALQGSKKIQKTIINIKLAINAYIKNEQTSADSQYKGPTSESEPSASPRRFKK